MTRLTARFLFAAAIAASALATAEAQVSSADDPALTPLPARTLQTPLPVVDMDYTDTTIRDARLPLLGFAEIGVEERLIENRFQNFDVWDAPEVEFGSGTAYRATVAGAGFRLRF